GGRSPQRSEENELRGVHGEQTVRADLPHSPGRPRPTAALVPGGEDPLSDSECDLDSVAGVLKLYFRGLEPPLFPYDSYSELLECV
ncbi:unnamed protein product, partial [Boreogadus saida]